MLLRILTAHAISHATSCIERALSNKRNNDGTDGQLAIAIVLPGFNDLGHSMTPVFLFMDYFLYRFSTFSEKRKDIYRSEVLIFCKFFLALRLSAVRRCQMPLEGLRFVKTLETFGIFNAMD